MDLRYINSSIDYIHAQVATRDSRKWHHQFLSSSIDKVKISGWTTNLDRGLQYFQVLVIISFSIVPEHSQGADPGGSSKYSSDPTDGGGGGEPSES